MNSGIRKPVNYLPSSLFPIVLQLLYFLAQRLYTSIYWFNYVPASQYLSDSSHFIGYVFIYSRSIAMIRTIAKWSCPDYFALSKKEGTPLLLCIPYSHFVELSRWCLQHTATPFREVGFAPVQHVLPVLNARINGVNGKKFVSTSSDSSLDVTRGGSEEMTEEQKAKSRQAKATAVPLLILPDGTSLVDSWSICESCCNDDFKKIDDQSIKDIYDKQLGPLVRAYVYSTLLKKSNACIWDKIMTNSAFGGTWSFLYNFFMKSTVTTILVTRFDANNSELRKTCRERLLHLFENELLARVRGRKGRFINGDKLSLEDIALSSLACPLVQHQLYCGGVYSAEFRELEELDQEHGEDLAFWRGTEVGRYVFSVYEHRLGERE